MEWTDEHEAEFERRLAPIVAVRDDWFANYFTSFAKRLDKAIRKARQR